MLCSCSEFVRQKLMEIMHPKTDSLAELSAILEGKLPLATLTEFLKPIPFGYPLDMYEDWALDKAKFVSEKFASKDNRKLNVFGRILVQRSLLTFFPEGPYTSVDKLSKARRKLEKSGIVMGSSTGQKKRWIISCRKVILLGWRDTLRARF